MLSICPKIKAKYYSSKWLTVIHKKGSLSKLKSFWNLQTIYINWINFCNFATQSIRKCSWQDGICMTETPKWGKMHVAEIKKREESTQSIYRIRSLVMLSWPLEYYIFTTIRCEVHMIFEVVKSYYWIECWA